MTAIEFAHDYEQEKQRVMKALWSCTNVQQLDCAENFFKALKNKWSEVLQTNATIKMLVEVDEYKFYQEFNSMYAQFNYLELVC
jgi:hypothetical protein